MHAVSCIQYLIHCMMATLFLKEYTLRSRFEEVWRQLFISRKESAKFFFQVEVTVAARV